MEKGMRENRQNLSQYASAHSQFMVLFQEIFDLIDCGLSAVDFLSHITLALLGLSKKTEKWGIDMEPRLELLVIATKLQNILLQSSMSRN